MFGSFAFCGKLPLLPSLFQGHKSQNTLVIKNTRPNSLTSRVSAIVRSLDRQVTWLIPENVVSTKAAVYNTIMPSKLGIGGVVGPDSRNCDEFNDIKRLI